MALAENAYLAYSKAMLARLERKEITPESVQNYIDQHLDSIISRYTDMQHPLYYRWNCCWPWASATDWRICCVRLCWKGQRFLGVELLGQVASDADMTYSCYCKALTCRNKEEMLVGCVVCWPECWCRKRCMWRLNMKWRRCWMSVRRTIGRCHRGSNSWSVSLGMPPPRPPATIATSTRPTPPRLRLFYANLSDVPVLVTNFNAAKSAVRFVTRDKRWVSFSNRIKGMSKLAFAKGQVWLCRFAELKEEAPSQVCACHQVTDHSHDEGFSWILPVPFMSVPTASVLSRAFCASESYPVRGHWR